MKVLVSMFAILSCFASTGCSSTSFSTKEPIVVSRIVNISEVIPPEAVPYIPQFVQALRENGFTVSDENREGALSLRFDINNSVTDMRFSASIWDSGVPILSASATNPGWGTLLARGSAMNDLAETSLEQFNDELSKMSSFITFKD